MPPRRSARVAAALEAASAAFPQLPHAVGLLIFAALPVDTRLRCCEVSRGWRVTASTPELWRRVNMSPASGVGAQPASLALLRAAVAKSRGALEALHLAESHFNGNDLTEFAVANPGLLELRGGVFTSDGAAAFLRIAPALRALRTGVAVVTDDVGTLLRNEGVYGGI